MCRLPYLSCAPALLDPPGDDGDDADDGDYDDGDDDNLQYLMRAPDQPGRNCIR